MSDTFALVIEEVPECLVERGHAAKHIAQNFKLPVEKALAIVDGQRRIVSRGLPLQEAQRYAQVFVEAGISAQVVEDAEQTQAKPRTPLTPQDIAQLFDGKVERPQQPANYGRSVAAVTALTVLLPIVYLSTMVGVAMLAVWYATASPVLENPSFHKLLFLYLVPLLAAVGVVVALVKPLLAPREKRDKPYVLNPDREPLLFAFVHEVCDRVDAPRPAEIHLDCQVNASAGFRRGISSFFDDDLVLTIGLPLVAGLTLRQFAGVLAHEFGHFNQGAGMRAGYVIYKINRWLHKVAYHRDQWDDKLEEWSLRHENYLGTVLTLVIAATDGVRYALRGLVWLANVVSFYMLRQMEFDADRFEANLAGSQEFKNTSLKMHLMGLAYESVLSDLGESWHERRLPDDIPALVVARASALEPNVKAQIQTALSQQTTRAHDTHPADNERIAAAEKLATPGIMRGNGNIASLFENFSGSCRSATCRLYKDSFGLKITRSQLIPNARFDKTIAKNQKTYDALDAYFLNFFNSFNYVSPGDFSNALKVAAEERLSQLHQLCIDIRRASPEARIAMQDHDSAKQAYFETVAKNKYLELNNKPFDERDLEKLAASVYGSRSDLRDFERPYTDRLEFGLATALADSALEGPANAKAVKKELEALVATQGLLARNQDNILQIYRYAASASVAEEYARQKPKFKVEGLQDELARLKTLIAKLRLDLQSVRYPFSRASGPATVLEHFDEDLNGVDSGSYSWGVYALLESIEKLHVRVVSRLAEIALQAENRHGVRLKLVG